jgi:hypothetical protein
MPNGRYTRALHKLCLTSRLPRSGLPPAPLATRLPPIDVTTAPRAQQCMQSVDWLASDLTALFR